jgi:hypothetical protein
MSVTLAAEVRHADDCEGRCSLWGIGTPTCMPYPCQCAKTKAAAPDWGKLHCWWVKRGTDIITSRCPCWGDRRDGKPGACCAHHSANPRYAPPRPPRPLDDLNVADLVEWERPAAKRVDIEDLWWDPEVEYAPYIPRWTREELTCPCATPFDQQKPARGWHCASCHHDFASFGVGEVHRRRWTEPCRPPETVVDVDTGFPLLRQGADGVWTAAYPTAG